MRMDFRRPVWKRVWKMTFFWSEVGSGFGELGSTTPPRIPKSTLGIELKVLCYTEPESGLMGGEPKGWGPLNFQIDCHILIYYCILMVWNRKQKKS